MAMVDKMLSILHSVAVTLLQNLIHPLKKYDALSKTPPQSAILSVPQVRRLTMQNTNSEQPQVIVVNVVQNTQNTQNVVVQQQQEEQSLFYNKRLWAGIVVFIQIVLLVWFYIVPITLLQNANETQMEIMKKDVHDAHMTIDDFKAICGVNIAFQVIAIVMEIVWIVKQTRVFELCAWSFHGVVAVTDGIIVIYYATKGPLYPIHTISLLTAIMHLFSFYPPAFIIPLIFFGILFLCFLACFFAAIPRPSYHVVTRFY